jgi:site-specific recombinase XerD
MSSLVGFENVSKESGSMKRRRSETLLGLVQTYFVEYLRGVRGASRHTMRAYRDALRLFFLFLSKIKKRGVAELRLDDVNSETVLAFLEHLEQERGNSPSTRNSRLAVLRSFAEHLLRHDLTRADQYARILSIPVKRATRRAVVYLEPEHVRAVIAQVPDRARSSIRDRSLLLLLYNTGARISEALALKESDLHLRRPSQVKLFGKGGKERTCPLWPETAAALRRLASEGAARGGTLFRNGRGEPLTRDGAAYILAKYARRATAENPSLGEPHVTPHVLRHSCAVALLQAGIDVSVIRDYLGHSSVTTTVQYITTNLQMKRQALEAFWKRAGIGRRRAQPWQPSPSVLTFLSTL